MRSFILLWPIFFWTNLASAESVSSMKQEACDSKVQADRELNDVYKSILKAQGANKEFISALKSAQRAWIAFREAHLNSVFCAENKLAEYGSSYTTCVCLEEKELIVNRISQLKRWVGSKEEGDVCLGTRMR